MTKVKHNTGAASKKTAKAQTTNTAPAAKTARVIDAPSVAELDAFDRAARQQSQPSPREAAAQPAISQGNLLAGAAGQQDHGAAHGDRKSHLRGGVP